MVKNPKLSDVSDRANCSTEMTERWRKAGNKTKQNAPNGKSGKRGQEREGGGSGEKEDHNVSSTASGRHHQLEDNC